MVFRAKLTWVMTRSPVDVLAARKMLRTLEIGEAREALRRARMRGGGKVGGVKSENPKAAAKSAGGGTVVGFALA